MLAQKCLGCSTIIHLSGHEHLEVSISNTTFLIYLSVNYCETDRESRVFSTHFSPFLKCSTWILIDFILHPSNVFRPRPLCTDAAYTPIRSDGVGSTGRQHRPFSLPVGTGWTNRESAPTLNRHHFHLKPSEDDAES